jgi:tRNA 2-thiouridine synthesizing protein A
MHFDNELDARGLSCPLPIVKIKMTLSAMGAGQILKAVTTDSGSVSDVKAFAEATGHELLLQETIGKEFIFFLKN